MQNKKYLNSCAIHEKEEMVLFQPEFWADSNPQSKSKIIHFQSTFV